MSTGWRLNTITGVLLLCLGVPCFGDDNPVSDTSPQSQQKTKKKTKKAQKPQLPPLPSGPTGPVQPIPLDSIAPVPPQVSYQNAQLTIVAPNSTLGDILRAVRKQTGAEIEIPAAPERVVTHLGPGSAREVMADLLNGSRFNYVLLGSPADNNVLTRVVLVAKTGQPDNGGGDPTGTTVAEQPQPGVIPHTGNPGAPLPEGATDPDSASADDSTDDVAADQAAAEAEQQPTSPDQPGVKTPQQMLQEMQQRQLQLQQQQQQGGQPPAPIPPRPPQEQE